MRDVNPNTGEKEDDTKSVSEISNNVPKMVMPDKKRILTKKERILLKNEQKRLRLIQE